MSLFRIGLIALVAVSQVGGCVSEEPGNARRNASGQGTPPNPGGEPLSMRQARVAERWQQDFYNHFEKDGALTEAYGLFTHGGWADAGQVMVFRDASRYQLRSVASAGEKIAKDRRLTEAEMAALTEAVSKAAVLTDFAVKQFDGVEYEFVQLSRADAVIKFERRVLVSAPDIDASPPHAALINAFMALR